MLAEGAAVHRLLPAGWFSPKVGGRRAHPPAPAAPGHPRAAQRTALPARVATTDVAAIKVARRRHGQRSGLVLGDAPPRLAVSGRTDVTLRFAAPVRIERPLGEPLSMSELSIAVDDPARFVAAIEAVRHKSPAARADAPRGKLAGFVDRAGALT